MLNENITSEGGFGIFKNEIISSRCEVLSSYGEFHASLKGVEDIWKIIHLSLHFSRLRLSLSLQRSAEQNQQKVGRKERYFESLRIQLKVFGSIRSQRI